MLRLAVAQWSPFAQTGMVSALSGDQLLVWVWDAAVVEAAQREAGFDPGRLRVIPESLLHPCLDEGLQCVACMDGFEGQYWTGRSLSASRWWSALPSEPEWLQFQRDAGIVPEEQMAALPQVGDTAWLARPWIAVRSTAWGGARLPLAEQLTLAAALMALIGASYWVGAQWFRYNDAVESLERRQGANLAKAAPLLQARGAALEALAAAQTLHDLDPYPSQLTLMAKIAELTGLDHAVLQEWIYERGDLKFTVASEASLLSAPYVRALQREPAFGGVEALPGLNPKTLSFRLTLSPGQALTPPQLPPQAGTCSPTCRSTVAAPPAPPRLPLQPGAVKAGGR